VKTKWFLSHLTYVDFMAYEILDHNRILFPSILDEFQILQQFMQDFEELPMIRNYLDSKRFRKLPLWSERSFLGRY